MTGTRTEDERTMMANRIYELRSQGKIKKGRPEECWIQRV
jgi:hypothetical protein